jgi:hypothetical protein
MTPLLLVIISIYHHIFTCFVSCCCCFRVALLKLESESESKESALRNNLSSAYDTIRAYELMMHTTTEPADTTDALSMHTTTTPAHTAAVSLGTSGSGSGSGKVPLAVSVLASDPRRLRLLLETSERNTAKLAAQDRLLNESRAKVGELEADLIAAQEQVAVLERVVDVSKHPASYAISRLQQREEDIVRLKREVNRLTAQSKQLETEVGGARQEGERLRERLKTLLEQRAEIEGLRELLQTVCMEAGSDDEASEYSATGDGGYGAGRGVWEEEEGYEEDGMWHDNASTDQHLDQQQQQQQQQHQQFASTRRARPNGGGGPILKVSPRQHHQQIIAAPSLSGTTISTPISKKPTAATSTPPAAAAAAAAAVGGGSGTLSSCSSPRGGGGSGGGVGKGMLSPAAVRAMTERNKGSGPCRTRVIEEEEEEEEEVETTTGRAGGGAEEDEEAY